MKRRNKQLYNSHCYVTAPQAGMFPRQRQNTAIMEETFSTRSVPRFYNQDQLAVAVSELEDCCGSLVVICCCEKLVAEARDRSGTQSKGNVRRWKSLPSNGTEDRD
jgi:hypothetical protein